MPGFGNQEIQRSSKAFLTLETYSSPKGDKDSKTIFFVCSIETLTCFLLRSTVLSHGSNLFKPNCFFNNALTFFAYLSSDGLNVSTIL